MSASAPLIAVVDDEPAVRAALQRLLRLADFDVATYASGEDLLASLAARPPACVLLDLNMPGLSGLGTLDVLWRDHRELPVICITAGEDASLAEQVAQGGARELLQKPFSHDALVGAVARALRGSPAA